MSNSEWVKRSSLIKSRIDAGGMFAERHVRQVEQPLCFEV